MLPSPRGWLSVPFKACLFRSRTCSPHPAVLASRGDNQWPGDIAAWREAGGSHISVVTDARITDGSVLEAERSQCLSRGRIFEHGAKALHRRAVEYLATGGRAALQGCGQSLARPLTALFGFSRYSLRVDPVFRSRHLDRHIRKENVRRRVVGLALMIQ